MDRASFERRNRDLDPQLAWRGKDDQNWSDLVVPVPPIYPQERIAPKALIDGLLKDGAGAAIGYYDHGVRGPNRMILGDSLQVMASLAEREGLRGQVQCIYVDPPYGIRFQSNFQWSTTSRDVKDGDAGHITREPEQVKAFRDTWRDGVHSYLTYLRDRLIVARDLLADSGSVFFQIGEENAHLARCLLDEVFGPQNFVADIVFRKKTMPLGARFLDCMIDHILWFAKDADQIKYRQLYWRQDVQGDFHWKWFETPEGTFPMSREQVRDHARLPDRARVFRVVSMKAPGYSAANDFPIEVDGKAYRPPRGGSWITGLDGMRRLCAAGRVFVEGRTPTYKLYLDDFPLAKLTSLWSDTVGAFGKRYVVETNEEIVKRCLLMATDPGDLVLDPTCGSGTTATVAEEWGRRWITIDTSRVALALARTRIMGAKYPWFRLANGRDPAGGFRYELVPHITLKAVANCLGIDEIFARYAAMSGGGDLRARQREIDEAVARNADAQWLYDKPEVEPKRLRVAGPFRVDGLTPHRARPITRDGQGRGKGHGHRDGHDFGDGHGVGHDFAAMILENLKTAGVQQADKAGRIGFDSLLPWPGRLVCAAGSYSEDRATRRAAIMIGPEFGTLSAADLDEAAQEAAGEGFDVLIACAFNFDGHAAGSEGTGPIPILNARINADLHMAEDLKNTGKGNLFVVFGEPDVDVLPAGGGQVQVQIKGIDVFHPGTGEIRGDGPDGIACWFIDTDYDGETFVVRHVYFPGLADPYKALRTTLKGDVDAEVWESLQGDTSRPFDPPRTGQIAVKAINHLGDEVLKVLRVAPAGSAPGIRSGEAPVSS